MKTKSAIKPFILCTLLIGAVATFVANQYHERSRYPRDEWRKISPFTDLKFEGDEKIIAEYEGTYYEVSSIEGISSVELIGASRLHFGRKWQKRIREDIADVLIAAGVPETTTVVGLELKELETGKIRTVSDAKMTKENRAILYSKES